MGRIVRIKLSLKDKDGKKVIEHEFEDGDLEDAFHAQDRKEFLPFVRPLQRKSKDNKDKKDSGTPLKVGDVVRADDYEGEPEDLHPAIHLRFNDEDKIVWFTTEDENVAFVIDVGLDPELVRLDEDLAGKKKLRKDDLMSERTARYSPFKAGVLPAICTKEVPIDSGPLRNDEGVRKQHFYKYQVTVLGTSIILDPHIEGHDEPFP